MIGRARAEEARANYLLTFLHYEYISNLALSMGPGSAG
jgi:hypothetical protein